jgi:integrase
MAFKEELPSGRYRGGYWAKVDGNRKKVWVGGTFRLPSEALAAANEAQVISRRQANRAKGTLPATITWDEWWELLCVDREFESDTRLVEDSLVEKHIRPRWGDTPLNEIQRPDIQKWVNSLCKQRTPRGTLYKPRTVHGIYGKFAMTINAAVACEPPVLFASPLKGIKLPKVPRRTKPSLPVEDIEPLSAALREDYADVVAFDMEVGLRPGELAGLHDDQVDLVGKLLTVRTVYVRRAKKMRDRPKDDDVRTIPLSTRAIEIYQRRVAGRDMSRPCGVSHYGDVTCRHDLVFRTKLGNVLDHNTLRQVMQRAAIKAKLPGRSGYALRRGFATRLARGGIDLFELMDIMGWSDPKLAREYIQESPGARDRMMAALGDPEVTELRLVGQDGPRGTDRGTGPDTDAPADAPKITRRKSS